MGKYKSVVHNYGNPIKARPTLPHLAPMHQTTCPVKMFETILVIRSVGDYPMQTVCAYTE